MCSIKWDIPLSDADSFTPPYLKAMLTLTTGRFLFSKMIVNPLFSTFL
jgi:hypothetical protein